MLQVAKALLHFNLTIYTNKSERIAKASAYAHLRHKEAYWLQKPIYEYNSNLVQSFQYNLENLNICLMCAPSCINPKSQGNLVTRSNDRL